MKGAILLVACAVLIGCGQADERTATQMTGGNADRGRIAIRHYGCGACHEIPGIDDARGLVGPSLAKIADRMYLAGQLPNQPDNLLMWIVDPQTIEPGTAMPDLDVPERDARDIAAYLYTLRHDR